MNGFREPWYGSRDPFFYVEMARVRRGTIRVQGKLFMVVLLCACGGMFGIHRYLMGYRNWWVMLLTLGGLGFWSFRDLVMICVDRMPMADGRELIVVG